MLAGKHGSDRFLSYGAPPGAKFHGEVEPLEQESLKPGEISDIAYTIMDAEQAKQFDAISDYKTNLTFNSLPYEQKMFEQDTVLKQKRERWHENLSKDVYVEEALNVLDDLNSTYRINKVATIKD